MYVYQGTSFLELEEKKIGSKRDLGVILMGRSCIRLGGSCARSAVRVRTPVNLKAPSRKFRSFSRNGSSKAKGTEELEGGIMSFGFGGDGGSRRIVVVVDPSLEARGALQWALSHAVQCHQDTIVLLHVSTPCSSKPGAAETNTGELNQRAYGLLYSMKNLCQMRRPGVQVEVALVHGKEKGLLILEEADRLRASLLVLGHRKRSMMWHLRNLCASSHVRSGVVEYCIQNASCMTVAVRQKSKKLGGYLITTKLHKNFWLLA